MGFTFHFGICLGARWPTGFGSSSCFGFDFLMFSPSVLSLASHLAGDQTHILVHLVTHGILFLSYLGHWPGWGYPSWWFGGSCSWTWASLQRLFAFPGGRSRTRCEAPVLLLLVHWEGELRNHFGVLNLVGSVILHLGPCGERMCQVFSSFY